MKIIYICSNEELRLFSSKTRGYITSCLSTGQNSLRIVLRGHQNVLASKWI